MTRDSIVSWTYAGNPAASNRDAVRFLIGDTDNTDQLLGDSEIDWALSNQGNTFAAASLCCQAIISSGRLSDKQVGDLKVFASQRAQQYRESAKELDRQVAIGALPYAGGISSGDKSANESNTDRVVPAFEVGMDDHPSLTAATT